MKQIKTISEKPIEELKNKTIHEYSISVKTIRKHYKRGSLYWWKKILWVAEIKQDNSKTIFCEDSEEELLNRIKENFIFKKKTLIKRIWKAIKNK